MNPVGGHGIGGGDCPQHYTIFVGAFIPHDSDRPYRKQDDPCLPNLVVKSPFFQPCDKNGIGFLENRDFLRGDLSEYPDSQSGPGKGCLLRNSCFKPRAFPTRRTSSLKRGLSGSTIFRFIFSGKPPTLWCDLMVAEGPLTDTDSITSG